MEDFVIAVIALLFVVLVYGDPFVHACACATSIFRSPLSDVEGEVPVSQTHLNLAKYFCMAFYIQQCMPQCPFKFVDSVLNLPRPLVSFAKKS